MAAIARESSVLSPGDRGRLARVRLLGATAAIEAALVLGILLPLRLDLRPPSLGTNLARVYGLDLTGLLLYGALAAVLMGAYLIAAHSASGQPFGRVAGALAATCLFAITLAPAHPTYSSDIFHYVATARVDFAHGANPHTTSPESFPDDPLMQLSGWKWLPSPYGAAWSLLSALPYAAPDGAATATGAVISFKALSILCLIGATAGVALAAETLRPGSGVRAALLFGWNPLVLIHLAADGHNDAAMLCALAWGLVALTAGHRGAALALFAAACLIKPAAGIAALTLLIVMLRGREWRAVAGGLAVALLLAFLCYWRYWAGAETFRAMLDEGRYFTNTPASLLQRLLEPSLGGDPARLIVGGVARLLLLLAIVLAARRSDGSPASVVVALAGVYLLAVIPLATWYQPWYATWPLLFVAVAAVHDKRWVWGAAALTAGGLLVPVSVNFIAEISGRGARDALIDALTVGLTLAPFAAAAVLRPWASPHGPAQGATVSSPQ